jgi:hypothetical protein
MELAQEMEPVHLDYIKMDKYAPLVQVTVQLVSMIINAKLVSLDLIFKVLLLM